MAFADQLLVIGLLAIVEQYCSRTLVELEQFLRQSRHPRAAPYRWDHIVDRFSSWGLRIIDYTAYADVDECRVVNNKVKHVGSVDTGLSRYAAFAGKLGTPCL
jgi:hypothetical protein